MADFTYVCNDFLKIYACRWRVIKMSLEKSKQGPKWIPKSTQNDSPGSPRDVQSVFLVLRAFCVISGSVFGVILGSIFEPKIVKKHVRKSNGKSMPGNAENVTQKGSEITQDGHKNFEKLILCQTWWNLKNPCFSAVKTRFWGSEGTKKTSQRHF